MRPIAITPGEPAGVGPELSLQLVAPAGCSIVLIADPDLLRQRARAVGLQDTVAVYVPGQPCPPVSVLPVKMQSQCQPGVLDIRHARYVLKTLDRAIDGCLNKEFAALVTGPVHKGNINDAGIAFSGHTEYLAERTNAPLPVMMLTTPGLRVALVTTHLPLSAVPQAITKQRLELVINALIRDLRQRYGLERPRVAVCGLNPHAGEGGHLGTEEIDIIIPTLEGLRQCGFDLVGPLPADTVFTPDHLQKVDAVLAMYHDQGLPVLKHKGFHNAVNVTLGLPIIRTSVDHGTALDLAGTGRASAASFQAALNEAVTLADATGTS